MDFNLIQLMFILVLIKFQLNLHYLSFDSIELKRV